MADTHTASRESRARVQGEMTAREEEEAKGSLALLLSGWTNAGAKGSNAIGRQAHETAQPCAVVAADESVLSFSLGTSGERVEGAQGRGEGLWEHAETCIKLADEAAVLGERRSASQPS